MRVLHGSFHQGDPFYVQNPGRQCMAVGLLAVVQHGLKSVFSWNAANLDEVITMGDSEYTRIKESGHITDKTSDAFLCTEDLPRKIEVRGNKFSCEYGTSFATGRIWFQDDEETDSNSVDKSLFAGLRQTFEISDQCLFTMCGYTCALIKENNQLL